jgi:hypothetical protein
MGKQRDSCVSASGKTQRAVEQVMSSENPHAPRERLSQKTLNLHFAIVSLWKSWTPSTGIVGVPTMQRTRR